MKKEMERKKISTRRRSLGIEIGNAYPLSFPCPHLQYPRQPSSKTFSISSYLLLFISPFLLFLSFCTDWFNDFNSHTNTEASHRSSSALLIPSNLPTHPSYPILVNFSLQCTASLSSFVSNQIQKGNFPVPVSENCDDSEKSAYTQDKITGQYNNQSLADRQERQVNSCGRYERTQGSGG